MCRPTSSCVVCVQTKQRKRAQFKGSTPGEGWFEVANIDVFSDGRDKKPIILANGQSLMLYKVDDDLYASEANSTAYKFPLTDAKIIRRE